ncbi:MAG: carbohydrate-binding domain-containing protein [Chthoniobacterales bacterium]
MKMRLPYLCATIVVLLTSMHAPAWAEITYLQLQSDGTHRLRQMNADGSGDVAIPLPFATMEYPTWSRDGALLAVTVPDPSRAFDKTHNVFAISAANGAITKLTNYQQQIDQINQMQNYVLATHKAFSPDRAGLATFSLNAVGPIGGGVNTFPVLEIHPVNAPGNALIMGVGSSSNHIHEGEGVDWAPNRNVLATALGSSAPNLSGEGTSGVTALFFVEPSDRALIQGQVQQLTFPRADVNISTGQAWAEHDYQPKFSRNGVGLAYVRSFQMQTLLDLTNPTPWTQSLRILNLNTGAETQVISFQPGFYVSNISWSPDGAQLAFDIGVQAISPIGIPLKQARPETNQVYVINTDGTGLVQLRGNGNSSPAFGPRLNTAPPARTRFETESLPVGAKSGATHTVISDSLMSGNAGTLMTNTAVGSFVTYTVPVARPGAYRVKVRVKTGANRGKFQLRINGAKQGAVQDEYSSVAKYQTRDLGLITFGSGGNKAFKFTVTGKNPRSAGVTLAFDSIDLVRQ